MKMKTMKRVSFKLMMLLSLGAVTLFTSCGSEDEEDPIPEPVASFTVTKLDPIAGEEITFTSTATDATAFSWSFGDGNTSTEESPSHTYTSEGSYTVTFSATGEGGTATADTTINVIFPNMLLADGVYDEAEDVVDYNIYSISLEAATATELINYPDDSERHIPVAVSNDGTKMYYLDNYNGDLYEANVDGTGERTIVTGEFFYPTGIALDASGNFYITERGDSDTGEGGAIFKVTPSGTVTELFGNDDGLELPTAIAIDQSTGDIYVNDVGASETSYAADGIWKGNVDGSSISKEITGGGYSIAIGGGMLYYNDAFVDENLKMASLDDLANPSKFADLEGANAYGISYFSGKVYWTDLGSDIGTGKLMKADASGSNASAIMENLTDPRGVALY